VRVTLASIPSPSQSVWNIGPFPLRAYALCIIVGVIAAVLISDRRMQARGGPKGAIMDIAVYAVPAGIIGARIYHVITSPQSYFGEGGNPIDALKIWEGGLGIWGAIAGGAVGAWYASRQLGLPLRVVADVVAPGLAVAQALGRFGNWFNQELFGKPTDLPWALEIEPGRPSTIPGELTYHPTFLYEALWCLGVAAFVIWAERRFKLGRGRVFALYVMAYVVGRLWIEALRIDEANHILGLRLNIWTCLIVFAGALWYFLTHSGPREQLVTSKDGTVRVLPEGETLPEPSDEASDEAADEASPDGTPEDRTPERRTPEDRTPEDRTPEDRTPADDARADAEPDEADATSVEPKKL
jgi:prolipoprotein diacylglyceryl transferase